MMTTKRIAMELRIFVISLVVLSAGFGSGCKKGVPTGPDGDQTIEISGLILNSGAPFAGVTVYLSWDGSKSTITGADGKFSFTNLAARQYIVTPSMIGTEFSPSNYEVGGATRKDLNFSASSASTGSAVGRIAPNFAARDQNGNSVNLYDFHGQVLLVDFTADWCTPCRAKAEHAEEFYQKYKSQGFMYILILIEGDPLVWAHTYGLTFPVLDDNRQTIYNMFRQASIPLPHVLDRNMTIRYKTEGWNQSEVEDILKKYL
jgi:peroxiredoxin